MAKVNNGAIRQLNLFKILGRFNPNLTAGAQH